MFIVLASTGAGAGAFGGLWRDEELPKCGRRLRWGLESLCVRVWVHLLVVVVFFVLLLEVWQWTKGMTSYVGLCSTFLPCGVEKHECSEGHVEGTMFLELGPALKNMS